jgi:hypothetical protein
MIEKYLTGDVKRTALVDYVLKGDFLDKDAKGLLTKKKRIRNE